MDKQFYVRFPSGFDAWMDSAFRDLESAWTNCSFTFPPTDSLLENETGSLVLHMAVAGYDPKDISIITEDGSILVEGKSKEKNDAYTVLVKGIKGSTFKTRYPIPTKFDLSKLEAKFENGILELKIPVAEERKPKKVEIKF